MAEQAGKKPGRLARALTTARVAVAVVTPLAGAVAPRQSDTTTHNDEVASQQVTASRDQELAARAQDAVNRERRRSGLELGYQLKQPDVVRDGTKPTSQRRER